MDVPEADFWESRYQSYDTPWASGTATPALVNYMKDKPRDMSVLIPGAGTSMEVIALLDMGFVNITLCDISRTAIQSAKDQISVLYPKNIVTFYHGDFFSMTGAFEVILEQTFFCALHPSLRVAYVDKMYDLLSPGGTLTGVLFNKEFDKNGPPYGGGENEYKSLFTKKFYIKEMSMCLDSIPPRAGSELFFICKKIVNL